jgi:dihydroxyacetone kinase-like predicted kinase
MLEQDTLNRINVFPVADGDTGTNLSLSLGASLGILKNPQTGHIGELLAAIADAMLDGARGNSGAIVAKFFQGLSDSAENLANFTVSTFSTAVACGSEYAHDALANPKEGTILSVIGAFARSLREQLDSNASSTFPGLLSNAVSAMQTALVRTQGQLEALRKAGVVDAGAKGFVALIEGMTHYLLHGEQVDERQIAAQGSRAHTREPSGVGFRHRAPLWHARSGESR